ncbi:MAG TPA: 16S rRNA (cytidine(1402)-2'-O)-methyltransferase [Dehalococcoidia bacterium]|nr:16S rRNA (cytidine(1402)-2'-O)-methyltransferase [Dehalococcoidia bacterium]
MGTLFLVATPVGNLEDITLRALRILGEVPLIAAEDTRMARRLLSHHGVRARRIISYNDHNKRARTPVVLEALAQGDVALVSDAGMPGISDPGAGLVVAAAEAGHRVVPVPGASAVILAVAASGLSSRRFHYLGFLPKHAAARRRALLEAGRTGDTIVVFESPHRLRATLADVQGVLGDRRVAVCRELTKLHEEIWRGNVAGALDHFQQPRGEIVLVIEGGAPAEAATAPDIEGAIARMRREGTRGRDALASLQALGLNRREAYRLWHGGR